MATDESADEGVENGVGDRLEDETDALDQRVIDLLAWVLDTETRARIYVHLRQHPDSTSEEIAEGTGLYPSTVRESLAALHQEGTVERTKRASAGAGNNPYEYRAIPPSELVTELVDEVQLELNTVFHLDEFLGGEVSRAKSGRGPVTIDVQSDE